MDLGLGFFADIIGDSDDSSSSAGSSSDGDGDQAEHEDLATSSGAVKRVKTDREGNAMCELLGTKTDQRNVGIEDLG